MKDFYLIEGISVGRKRNTEQNHRVWSRRAMLRGFNFIWRTRGKDFLNRHVNMWFMFWRNYFCCSVETKAEQISNGVGDHFQSVQSPAWRLAVAWPWMLLKRLERTGRSWDFGGICRLWYSHECWSGGRWKSKLYVRLSVL